LFEVARDFSPRIERHGDGCVVLDVSGLERLLGDAHAIGAALMASAPAGNMRVAVAPTQVAARLLAVARPGLTVVAHDAASALAALPLAALQQLLLDVPAGQPATAATPATKACTAEARRGSERGGPSSLFDVLDRWGLKTLGELAALPSVELSERMGQRGPALQRLACGIDPAPLVPDPGVPRFVQVTELEWPIEQLEALSFVLARLLDPLSAALERADRGAAAIHVELRLVDRAVHARVLQLPAAMRDPRVLRTLVLLDLESHPPAAGIDVVSVELDPAPARIVQYSLLERARPSAETVATLTARLNALVGESRCGSPVLLDTHRPDAVEMRRFAPRESGSSGARGIGSSGGPRTPDPPISIRRFRPPIAIRVAVEHARPAAVAIDRRGMPGGRVTQVAGPWRTSGAWWDGAGTHWDRDEWDIALSDGSLCRLFRDRATERWFLEGVID
jgi:protein ImuB